MKVNTSDKGLRNHVGRFVVTVLPAIALGAALSAPLQAQPYAYLPNLGSNTVTVIDTATDTVVTHIPVQIKPQAVVVNNDGSLVYVANRDSDTPEHYNYVLGVRPAGVITE